jgi:hypothetical protein
MHRLKCLDCNIFGYCQTNADLTEAARSFLYDTAKREKYHEAHEKVLKCDEFTERKRCDT